MYISALELVSAFCFFFSGHFWIRSTKVKISSAAKYADEDIDKNIVPITWRDYKFLFWGELPTPESLDETLKYSGIFNSAAAMAAGGGAFILAFTSLWKFIDALK